MYQLSVLCEGTSWKESATQVSLNYYQSVADLCGGVLGLLSLSWFFLYYYVAVTENFNMKRNEVYGEISHVHIKMKRNSAYNNHHTISHFSRSPWLNFVNTCIILKGINHFSVKGIVHNNNLTSMIKILNCQWEPCVLWLSTIYDCLQYTIVYSMYIICGQCGYWSVVVIIAM